METLEISDSFSAFHWYRRETQTCNLSIFIFFNQVYLVFPKRSVKKKLKHFRVNKSYLGAEIGSTNTGLLSCEQQFSTSRKCLRLSDSPVSFCGFSQKLLERSQDAHQGSTGVKVEGNVIWWCTWWEITDGSHSHTDSRLDSSTLSAAVWFSPAITDTLKTSESRRRRRIVLFTSPKETLSYLQIQQWSVIAVLIVPGLQMKCWIKEFSCWRRDLSFRWS